MMDFHALILLCFLILLTLPQFLCFFILIKRRQQQPIKYRGVWLILLSGVSLILVFLWHMLFLIYEVNSAASSSSSSSSSNNNSSSNNADDADGNPIGLHRYFCNELQWILYLSNITIFLCYLLRTYRVLKIFSDHSNMTNTLMSNTMLSQSSMLSGASGGANSIGGSNAAAAIAAAQQHNQHQVNSDGSLVTSNSSLLAHPHHSTHHSSHHSGSSMLHPSSTSSSSGAHINSPVLGGLQYSSSSSNNLAGMMSLGANSSSASSAFSHHRLEKRIYTESYLMKVLFGALIFFTILKLILDHTITTSSASSFSGFNCHNSHNISETYSWLGVDMFECLLLVIGIYKLRMIRDDYGISIELITVLIVNIVCTIGIAISIILRHSSHTHFFHGSSNTLGRESYLEFQTSILSIRAGSMFFITVAWPVIQSFYYSFPPLWSNCDALCSLDTLLKDIVCIQYFRNYLVQINRVEWILMWVETELFKDLNPDDVETIGMNARRIYERYCQLGAELEVHLSPSIVHLVTREVHVGSPSITCFEEAQKELLALMEAEFPRFLSSPSCEACLQELEREEVLREVLERSGMI